MKTIEKRMTYDEYISTLNPDDAKEMKSFFKENDAELVWIISKDEIITITDHEKIWNS